MSTIGLVSMKCSTKIPSIPCCPSIFTAGGLASDRTEANEANANG
jgi:hypothetical protein